MATLLKHPRGLGLRYQPTAIGNYDFSDSRDDLLHGLLIRRLGTCTSFPVLFVAIGRRLGYPMHLAIAKGHVLCQWVDELGRLNLEGSCAVGGETAPDEHHHAWPQRMTPDDLASNRFLRPLSRAEELALFLETRGHCLIDNRRVAEARQAYESAKRVAPNWSEAELYLLSNSLYADGGLVHFCGVQMRSPRADLSSSAAVPLFQTFTSLPVERNKAAL